MKKMAKPSAIIFVTGLTLTALAGCGEPPSSQTQSDSVAGGSGAVSDAKVCMVASLGGLNDRSFNESTHEGFQRAESDLGVEISVVSPAAQADFVPAINNMLAANCGLIVGVGFLMEGALGEAAKNNPDVSFALVDSTFPEELPNAKALVFDTAQASFLAGYLAAGMSESGRIATFLGAKIPPTMIFADGYADGAAYFNEVHGSDVKVLGWDVATQDGMATGNFEDVARGQQFANQLFQQGADIIMPVAGPVGAGALAATQSSAGTMAIWVDSDGYYAEPSFSSVILTSVMKQTGNAVFDTIQEYSNGDFTNVSYIGTLENEGVGLAPYHDFEDAVPQELKDEVEALRQSIISGEVVITSASSPKA